MPDYRSRTATLIANTRYEVNWIRASRSPAVPAAGSSYFCTTKSEQGLEWVKGGRQGGIRARVVWGIDKINSCGRLELH